MAVANNTDVRRANQTALQKSTADFSEGATMSPVQFDEFMRLVEDQSDVLTQARQFNPGSDSGNIPQIGVSPRLIRAVDEGESTALNTIDSGDVPFQTQKVSLPWQQTWEENNELIDDPEEQKRQLFANQFANDLEILASVGDEANADAFVSINDGWLTLADAAGVATHDHMDGGTTAQPVNTELFKAMRALMPERYEEQQELVFLLNYKQKEAYETYLAENMPEVYGQYIAQGGDINAFGHDILTPLGWPSDRAMMTSMQNLAYLVQDPLRVKQTSQAKDNVLNDIDTIYNMLAKVDYQLLETEGVVTASNIASPTA